MYVHSHCRLLHLARWNMAMAMVPLSSKDQGPSPTPLSSLSLRWVSSSLPVAPPYLASLSLRGSFSSRRVFSIARFFLSFSPRWRTPSPPARHVRQSDCAHRYAQCNVATMNFLKSRSPSSPLHSMLSYHIPPVLRHAGAPLRAYLLLITRPCNWTRQAVFPPALSSSPRHQPSTPPPLSSLMPSLHQLAAELPLVIADICMISVLLFPFETNFSAQS